MTVQAKRWLVLAAGLLALGFGIWRQDVLLVWRKAINICLGCIGIG